MTGPLARALIDSDVANWKLEDVEVLSGALISMETPWGLTVLFHDTAKHNGSTLEFTLQGTGQQPHYTKVRRSHCAGIQIL